MITILFLLQPGTIYISGQISLLRLHLPLHLVNIVRVLHSCQDGSSKEETSQCLPERGLLQMRREGQAERCHGSIWSRTCSAGPQFVRWSRVLDGILEQSKVSSWSMFHLSLSSPKAEAGKLPRSKGSLDQVGSSWRDPSPQFSKRYRKWFAKRFSKQFSKNLQV